MKTSQNFGLLYVLLAICQIILCNYTNLGPYIMLSLLPAMILCLPTSIGAIGSMLIAFATGLCTDWLSEGIIGLNAAALIPAAAIRKGIIKAFFGEDMADRNATFTVRKNGLTKVSFSLLTVYAVFLGTYIFLDGAGTRPLWFIFSRLGASLVCNWLLGLLTVSILNPDDRK